MLNLKVIYQKIAIVLSSLMWTNIMHIFTLDYITISNSVVFSLFFRYNLHDRVSTRQ